jgi:hypothetical protein
MTDVPAETVTVVAEAVAVLADAVMMLALVVDGELMLLKNDSLDEAELPTEEADPLEDSSELPADDGVEAEELAAEDTAEEPEVTMSVGWLMSPETVVVVVLDNIGAAPHPDSPGKEA